MAKPAPTASLSSGRVVLSYGIDRGILPRIAKVLIEPDALVALFADLRMDMTRIGLEVGSLAQRLYDGLAEAGLPLVCAETRRRSKSLTGKESFIFIALRVCG